MFAFRHRFPSFMLILDSDLCIIEPQSTCRENEGTGEGKPETKAEIEPGSFESSFHH